MLNILAAVPGYVFEGSSMHVHPGVPGGARCSRHRADLSKEGEHSHEEPGNLILLISPLNSLMA